MAPILKFKNSKYSDQKIYKSTVTILSATKLFSVASIKDQNTSYIHTAFYCYSNNFSLYFLTPPTAQHSKNFEENQSVAVAVYNSGQGLENKKGLQIFGSCHKAKGKDLEEGYELYAKRFTWLKNYIKSTLDFKKKIIQSRVYVIKPKIIKIFDEPAFGNEKWVTVSVG